MKFLVSLKSEGKDWTQNLQRDLRYTKIATNGQIFEDETLERINSLITKVKFRVSSTVANFGTPPNMMPNLNNEIEPSSPGYTS